MSYEKRSRPPRRVARRTGVLVALAVLGALSLHGSAAQADGPGVGSPWVASVGDSYISGEAGRWAGNSNVSSSNIDALGSTAYYDNATNTAEHDQPAATDPSRPRCSSAAASTA